MDRVKKIINYWCKDTEGKTCLGRGITAAVLDTGISPHPDLKGRIRGFQDLVHHRRDLYDDSGHGTHVAGILLGDGRMSGGILSGVAPEAAVVALKVLDEKGDGSVENILAGLRWVRENRRRYGIRIVNLSVGAKADLDAGKEQEFLRGVEQLWDEGLVVIVSAGNQGPARGTVAVPGTSRKVITVGALKTNERIQDISGRGPTKDCVVKPDLLAPGYQILSCRNQFGRRTGYYTVKSGTSMAAPVATGAAALYLSKYPGATNAEVKLRMMETCRRIKERDGSRAGRALDVAHFLNG
ncbi:S8 family peptidase [Merdimonas faecis]|uniref:S8 family peptidase n=1 Tax=Merdimonas faecis TaxID=1653435 RepID=UPI0008637CC0|nr:S8 family peptidase [Merdimonas faecis]